MDTSKPTDFDYIETLAAEAQGGGAPCGFVMEVTENNVTHVEIYIVGYGGCPITRDLVATRVDGKGVKWITSDFGVNWRRAS